MEVTTGTVVGGVRLGLQVLSAHKRPHLEIYVHLRHTLGPSEEYDVGGFGTTHARRTHRPQDIALEFTLINIGGQRAENVCLNLEGDFEYISGQAKLSRLPVLNGTLIPQLAPAEALHIFRFNAWDLVEYDDQGKPRSHKQTGFRITIGYDGPSEGLNKLKRGLARVRRPHQYVSHFRFSPGVYDSLDLPTPEVLG